MKEPLRSPSSAASAFAVRAALNRRSAEAEQKLSQRNCDVLDDVDEFTDESRALQVNCKLKAIDVAAVHATLERLLAEDKLKLSERNRRFLAFVVSEALSGRADRIKAYTIGVDVFGRGEDFDPSNDPIVRIEATRIRSALSAYYEKSGADDPIKILIPPGSYVPVFTSANGNEVDLDGGDDDAADVGRPLISGAYHRPSIIVTARAAIRDHSYAMLVELFRQSIAARLREMKLRVFLSPSPERKATTRAVEQLLLRPDAVYALDIALYATAEGYRQSWALIDLSTGELMDSMLEAQPGKSTPAESTIEAIVDKAARMIEYALALN